MPEATNHVNGTSQPAAIDEVHNEEPPPKHSRTGTDPDAQEMVIASLRSQIQDLFSQVNELNNKLVKSYDRVSDLEDDIHVSSANLRSSSLRISQLELERTQHLAALNTGLLVEKAHVTAELNRLMEKATEEAAQRGQAESARHDIEKELDDLSASLFAQANTMVAEARFAQHLSERKVDDAERALKGAEEMVGLMQVQMQAMQAGKEETESKMQEMQVLMGKGKWNERIHQQTVDLSRPLKLLSSHVPYQEFLMFVAHLRTLHQSSPNVPAMPTLLPLPFLARLSTEDAEPTMRLDLAPALNWLSRRSVLSAVQSGQLTIEPIPVSALFSETALYSSPTTVAGINLSNDNVTCALCGTLILSATEHAHSRRRPTSLTNSGWSGSFFKRTSLSNSSHPPSPTGSVQVSRVPSQNGSQQVYIFRVASPQSSSLPIPSSLAKSLSQGTQSSGTASPNGFSTPNNNQPMTIYPLCSSGWCLIRLRTTCTLWSFVRTGIVDKVWEEEIPFVPAPLPPSNISVPASDKPPVPPPRKRGIWGIASAIGERAASWSDSGEKKPTPQSSPPSAQAPPLPPRRDSVARPPPRRLPPPPQNDSSPPPMATTAKVGHVPPPLPKRSEVRKRASLIVLDGNEDEGEGEDNGDGAATPSNPSTPMKVVFDAGVPQSPVRVKQPATEEKNEDNAIKGEEELPVATESGEEAKDVATSVPLPKTPPPIARLALETGGRDSPALIESPTITAAGVGTPPPLPRRAAARRVPPPPDGESRPSTPSRPERRKPVESAVGLTNSQKVEDPAIAISSPAPPPPVSEKEASGNAAPLSPEEKEVGKDDQETKTVEEEVKEPKDMEVEESKVDVDVEVKAVSTEGAKQSVPSSDSGDDDDDEFVDAPATNFANNEPAKSEVPTITTSTTSSGSKSDETSKANDDEETAEVVKELDDISLAHGTLRAESPPSAEEGQDGNDEIDPHSGEVYIGDATWEERTWKELVKLKEDMFWSRIGGWR